MRLLAWIAFITSTLAARVNVNKRESSLEVNIKSAGNSAVRASITNTGADPIKLFKAGSVLDSIAVEKAEIFSGADQVAFDGIRLQLQTSNLNEDAFQTIGAGETVEAEWDPAEVHDLSTGGDFDFLVRGAFLTADANGTSVSGAIPFDSNVLTSHVDGATAAKVRRDFHDKINIKKRTSLEYGCTGSRGTVQRNALSRCAQLARAAAQAAQAASNDGSASKLTEYFKSSSSSTRTTVAQVFNNVADECDSTTSGVSEQYCTDALDSCGSNLLAYTFVSEAVMVSCPLYFDELGDLTTTCHHQDQATTTLHEMTHLTQIKGTQDYGYGYSSVRSLSSSQNLNNADTYSLFANGMCYGSVDIASVRFNTLYNGLVSFADL